MSKDGVSTGVYKDLSAPVLVLALDPKAAYPPLSISTRYV